MEKLEKYFNNKNLEIEARFGSFGDKKNFISNNNRETFGRIFSYLVKNGIKFEFTKEKVLINGKFNKIINLDDETYNSYRTKENVANYDDFDRNIRISVSKEENISTPPNVSFDENEYRLKERYSFDEVREENMFYGIRIDLTIVSQKFKGKENTFYEIEFERINASYKDFSEKLNKFYYLIEGYSSLNIGKVDISELILNTTEKLNIINQYNNFLKLKPKVYGNLGIYRNEAYNIKKKNLLSNDVLDFAVTTKLDGVRTFLFLYNKNAYLVNAPFNIIRIANNLDYKGTILYDGELLDNGDYYIFDIVKDDKDTQEQNLKERLKNISTNYKLNFIKLIKKKFYFDDFYKSTNDALDENKEFNKKNIGTDGIIIQSIEVPYKNEETYKWKDENNLTIDFLVKKTNNDNYNLLTRNKNKEYVIFRGNSNKLYLKNVNFPEGKFLDQEIDGKILEFKWQKDNFVPYRIRNDRPFPNDEHVAFDIWNDIHNPITEETIRGKDLVIMRALHNKIKEGLLEKYVNALKKENKETSLLDIGSGRGGDLQKWKDLGLKVYAVEPNRDNYEELLKRNKKTNVPLQLIKNNIEDLNRNINVNLIASFFSATFLQKVDTVFEKFVKVVDNCLNTGGYFIGTVMDSERVKKLLGSKDKYENEAFTISRNKNKISVNFKNDKTSMIKDVEEYLFNFQLLVEKFKEIGIEIVVDKSIYKGKIVSKKIKFDENIYRDENFVISKMMTEDRVQIQILNENDALKNLEALGIKIVDYSETKGFACEEKYLNCFIDKNIEFLPKDSKEFSSLNRVFVFKRKSSKLSSTDFKFGKFKSTKLDNPTLLDAILRGTDMKKYMESQNKKAFVDKCRGIISRNLNMESLKYLGDGYLYKNLYKKYFDLYLDEEKSNKELLNNFRNLIETSSLFDNLEIIQLISNSFNVNILFVSSESRDLYLPNAEKYISPSEKCKLLYQDSRPSIILLKNNEEDYEILSQDKTYFFEKNSNLINNLIYRVCSEDQFDYANYPSLISVGQIVKKNKKSYIVVDIKDDNTKVIVLGIDFDSSNKEQEFSISELDSEDSNVIGKKAKIIKGNYKGYYGNIYMQEKISTKFKIYIDAVAKYVFLNRNEFKIV